MNYKETVSYIETHKYDYAHQSQIKVKAMYLFGLLAWGGVLFGYSQFFKLDNRYFLIFGWIIILITIYNVLNYGINLFYKSFDIAKHDNKKFNFFKSITKLPTVDVYLPICGEDMELLRKTWQGVKALNYKNKTVYVLDDIGDKKAEKLAKEFDFNYLSRPNKGEMKKAGNIMYAFNKTKGDFYIVFDSDFVPHPEFINELLPYTNDKSVAIVQSPQYFEVNNKINAKSPIEYGSATLQEDFYKTIQVARDNFSAAICVGSNAIYRRVILEKVGGPAMVDHGEDVHTGFKITNAGYKVKYVPIILALGLSPDSIFSLFKQHNRWCSSSTGMLLSGMVADSNLSLIQKVCYYCGFIYYLSQILFFILPFQLYLMLQNHYVGINIEKALPFYPYIIFAMIILPLSRINKPKLGIYIANIITIYTHVYTIFMRFIGKPATWVPTNTIKKDLPTGFYPTVLASCFFVSLLTFLLLDQVNKYHFPVFNFEYYSVLFWILWNTFIHSLFLFTALKALISKGSYEQN